MSQDNKPKFIAMIQARMGSSRLPNKVLKDICGKPDLQWVVERVRRSRFVDEVMVITSIDRNNLPLIRLCTELGVRIYVGSEDDVLDRYYQAARLVKSEYVVRITADCPMYDWNVLDDMIENVKFDTDYSCISGEDFPDGLDTEIVRFEALERAWQDARLSSEREHVTQYIKKHPELFSIREYVFPLTNVGHYRWTLDEEADFQMIEAVYQHFLDTGKEDFTADDIITFLKAHPEIEAINSNIGRNEGLLKSIREDYAVK